MPINGQVKVDLGIDFGLHIGRGVKLQTVLRQACTQVQLQQVRAQLDTAVKAQRQAVLVQTEAQARTDTGLGRPVRIQIRLQARQGRHAQLAVHGGRQTFDAGHPGGVHVAVDVLLHIVAHADQWRQVQDVVERLVDQGQLLAVLQIGPRLAHLTGHAQQGAAQTATQGHIQIRQ